MGDDVVPEIIYVRTEDDAVDPVRGVLGRTVNPQTPEEVEVSRPSDILAAQDAADTAFTSLFLGLGAVALLVGGIGIANVMVIAVIERRTEIGLRRALGATKAHIRRQFLTEALLLAGAGGLVGVALGAGSHRGVRVDQELADRHSAGRDRRRHPGRDRDRRDRRSVPGRTRRPSPTHRRPALIVSAHRARTHPIEDDQ